MLGLRQLPTDILAHIASFVNLREMRRMRECGLAIHNEERARRAHQLIGRHAVHMALNRHSAHLDTNVVVISNQQSVPIKFGVIRLLRSYDKTALVDLHGSESSIVCKYGCIRHDWLPVALPNSLYERGCRSDVLGG